MAIRRKRRTDFALALENPSNHGEFPAGLGVNLPGERLVDGVADGRPLRLDWLRTQVQGKIQEVSQHETALRVTGAGIGLLIGVGVSVFAYSQVKQRMQKEPRPAPADSQPPAQSDPQPPGATGGGQEETP